MERRIWEHHWSGLHFGKHLTVERRERQTEQESESNRAKRVSKTSPAAAHNTGVSGLITVSTPLDHRAAKTGSRRASHYSLAASALRASSVNTADPAP